MIDPNIEQEIRDRVPDCKRIAGVDEVGRGPWAGPVTACAVVLDPNNIPNGLADSKKLSAAKREVLFDQIYATADVGLAHVSLEDLDRMKILQAPLGLMKRAVDALAVAPDFALIDGNKTPADLPCPSETLVKGDGRCLSIAAASIVAKVTRDRMMVALAQQFPGYGWETNAGYGTRARMEGLAQHGVTQHHRRSFKPIHNILCS